VGWLLPLFSIMHEPAMALGIQVFLREDFSKYSPDSQPSVVRGLVCRDLID
jgi:hypothetical protein